MEQATASELHLVDVFDTIQGEGTNAGRAALFIRMPFCNLACPWCDTEFDKFKKWSLEDFEKVVSESKANLAVITGGEPTMHKHTPSVIKILKNHGFEIAMESNGQFKAPAGINFLTVSPKRWKNKNIEDMSSKFQFVLDNAIGEIKLVVDGEDCFQAANDIWRLIETARVTFVRDFRLYLSPEWNTKEIWLPKIVEYVMKNPQWRISLQTHKILDVK